MSSHPASFLLAFLLAFPSVVNAEDTVFKTLLGVVADMDDPGGRIALLSDAALARMKCGQIDEAVALAKRIEPVRERKSLLRRLALLAADRFVQQEADEWMWGHAREEWVEPATVPATKTKKCEMVVRTLLAVDPAQSSIVGEVALRMLNESALPGPPSLDFFDPKKTARRDTVRIAALRLTERFEHPFGSDRATCDFLAALAKAGDADAAEKGIDRIDDDAYKNWARLAILEERARQGDVEGAVKIANAFDRPEQRSWALLSVARNEKHSRLNPMCLHSHQPCPCDNPQVRPELLKRAAEAINRDVPPEHAGIQLRILAEEMLRANPESFDSMSGEKYADWSLRFENAQRELAREGLVLLRRAEEQAWKSEPEALRLERLAVIVRAYRLHALKQELHTPLADRIRESLDAADEPSKQKFTPDERVRIMEALRQALGEPVDAALIREAAADPGTRERLGEILLRDANIRSEPNAAPGGDPEADRLRLPFDVYENYYYSPFAVESDCGC